MTINTNNNKRQSHGIKHTKINCSDEKIRLLQIERKNTQITWGRVVEKRFYYVGSKVMFLPTSSFSQSYGFFPLSHSLLFVWCDIWSREKKKWAHNWAKMIRWSRAIQIKKSGNLWKRKYINDLKLVQHLIQHVPPNKSRFHWQPATYGKRKKKQQSTYKHTINLFIYLVCNTRNKIWTHDATRATQHNTVHTMLFSCSLYGMLEFK